MDIKSLEDEIIHANAREARARSIYRQIIAQERPDIAVAIILQGLDDWYNKGIIQGKRNA